MGKNSLTLEEIRDGYREVLELYDESYSHFRHRKSIEWEDDYPEGVDRDSDISTTTFQKNLTEKARSFKEAADRSVVTWRYGDPLENLNQGLRKRIETALMFGI